MAEADYLFSVHIWNLARLPHFSAAAAAVTSGVEGEGNTRRDRNKLRARSRNKFPFVHRWPHVDLEDGGGASRRLSPSGGFS